MHEASCFVEMYEYLTSGKIKDVVNLSEFESLLKTQIAYSIRKDTTKWNAEYICKPALFLKSRTSVFYEENKEICDYECGFIEETQKEDGTWNVTWAWTEYPEQWVIAEIRCRRDIILKNMK